MNVIDGQAGRVRYYSLIFYSLTINNILNIIILLILAGISISALTNTGIFGKAKDAKQKSDEAALDQNTKLDEYESEINAYLPGQNNGGGGQGSGINANTMY